ncbi:hypothetical protein SEUCBS140593_002479 [Sporothrix eucalyptigena]|uniref:Rhodopsin domain-containing protein n=1 Tax=Sporothrix eucalyptigena TaxID=1812306 RepID=A0ABP0B6Z1_9PEZI
MRLPIRQKTILVLTFALGIFVTVVDVVRIYYLQQAIIIVRPGASSDPDSIFGDVTDFAWNASLSFMWSAVEVNIGITCACIPTLKPLIIKIFPALVIDPYASNYDSSSRTRGTDASNAGSHLTDSQTSQPPSVSESIKYCTIVAVLFFLWGFSYGLLNTLNNVVAAVANMTTAQTLGLTSAYFGGGYFFGPLVVGEWVLRHDEHRRLRGSGPHRQSTSRGKREKRGSSLGAIPATVASVGSVPASAATNRSRRSDSDANDVGGFKATFMVGLCFYGIGTMMFWPSAVLTSFPGFLISSFVVGFGLSILETGANPFIALCGPSEYSEMRLLLAQAAQGIGSVLSGLLAQNVFFVNVGTSGTTNSATLLDVQWTYLAITLFCVILALFFYYIPLPELHDAELEEAASRLPVDGKKKSFFGLQLRTICLILAIFAQWTYVASQESMSIYFQHLVTSWLPDGATTESTNITRAVRHRAISSNIILDMATSSITPDNNSDNPAGLTVSVPNYLLIAHTAFAVSRAFTGYIVYLGVKHPKNHWLPSPRTILTVSTVLITLFSLLIVVLKPSHNQNLVMIPVALYFLAEGPVWPLVFAIGLRGQGTRTKRAAAYITMGASGPLFWPFVMYAVMKNGGTIQIAFIIVVALMAACTLYPLFLTFVRDARNLTKVTSLYPGGDDASGAPQASRAIPHRAAIAPGELDCTILDNLPDGRGENAKVEKHGNPDRDSIQDSQSRPPVVSTGSASTGVAAASPAV